MYIKPKQGGARKGIRTFYWLTALLTVPLWTIAVRTVDAAPPVHGGVVFHTIPDLNPGDPRYRVDIRIVPVTVKTMKSPGGRDQVVENGPLPYHAGQPLKFGTYFQIQVKNLGVQPAWWKSLTWTAMERWRRWPPDSRQPSPIPGDHPQEPSLNSWTTLSRFRAAPPGGDEFLIAIACASPLVLKSMQNIWYTAASVTKGVISPPTTQEGKAALTVLDNLGAISQSAGNAVERLRIYKVEARLLEMMLGEPGGSDASRKGLELSAEQAHLRRREAERELGDWQDAGEDFMQSLVLARELKKSGEEADALNYLGAAYQAETHFDFARAAYHQALEMEVTSHSSGAEGDTLNRLGTLYQSEGHLAEALDCYHRALLLAESWKRQDVEGGVLTNLGLAYSTLGRFADAIRMDRRALALARSERNLTAQAVLLNNLGGLYHVSGSSRKAISFLEQAAALAQREQDLSTEGAALGSLGSTYNSIGQFDRAIAAYERALALARQIHNRRGEGAILHNLGLAYATTGRNREAIGYYDQALPIRREVGDLVGEGFTLNNLMTSWSALGNRNLAIFYGKLAVNTYQQIRQDIHTLSQTSQQSFLTPRDSTYRELAALLAERKRLPEAEQALGLLKTQEYLGFVRAGTSEAGGIGGMASLTPEERQAYEKYIQLTAGGGDTSDQTTQYLDKLAAQFPANSGAALGVHQLKDTDALCTTLGHLPKGSVAVYTLITPKKLILLLVTPDTQLEREYPITAESLQQKVLDLQQVMEHPWLDPRPKAAEMYKILVSPVEPALRQFGASTLLWSLDGCLRYVPVDALYDQARSQYLIERYRNVLFTPATLTLGALAMPPASNWNVLFLGVHQKYPNFPLLTEVPAEEAAIVRATASRFGVLEGTPLINKQFNLNAMLSQLKHGYRVVHIATHFALNPGDNTHSFLLLGDGSHLTLADFEKLGKRLLDGVNLVTLSACDTAVANTGSDGSELEGMAVLAEKKGAEAVLASLRAVDDYSTMALMRQFYAGRQERRLTKAEALREARLSLLHGTPAGISASDLRGVEFVGAGHGQATFHRYPNAPFAHPFYWAPFVLIGNPE